MARLLVVAPNWIGDALMAQPLLERLHASRAGATVDVPEPEDAGRRSDPREVPPAAEGRGQPVAGVPGALQEAGSPRHEGLDGLRLVHRPRGQHLPGALVPAGRPGETRGEAAQVGAGAVRAQTVDVHPHGSSDRAEHPAGLVGRQVAQVVVEVGRYVARTAPGGLRSGWAMGGYVAGIAAMWATGLLAG